MAIVIAGGKTFKTKKSLLEHCKYILNNTKKGLLEGKTLELIDDVLRMHPRYIEKVGTEDYQIGIRNCTVNAHNNQFYILREDGSDTDFSYYKCLLAESKETKFKKALRHLVKDQSIRFKEDYFKSYAKGGYVICPVTNLKIKKKDSHLDHFPTQFEEIVEDWMELNSIRLKDIKLKSGGDNSTCWFIDNKFLEESFYKYHEDKAEYRVVLNKVNLQRHRARVKLK